MRQWTCTRLEEVAFAISIRVGRRHGVFVGSIVVETALPNKIWLLNEEVCDPFQTLDGTEKDNPTRRNCLQLSI